MITAQIISDALGIPLPRAEAWFVPINNTLHKFNISSNKEIAAFLSQIGEESELLIAIEENLNYSAHGLLTIFPTHFTADEAQAYAHKPAAIAAHVYANRHGNGNEASAEGWKYRGRGLIQITFKDNYAACGRVLGINLIECPELLAHPDLAALSAGWYWDSHGCNALADAGDIVGVSRRVNGGDNGLESRIALYSQALKVLEAHNAT